MTPRETEAAIVCCQGDQVREKEGVFALQASLKTELSRFLTLREKDPKLAGWEIKRGAVLVGLARDGRLDRLTTMVRSRPPCYWFTAQMFAEAAVAGRTEVIDFMVSEAAPLDSSPLCDILTQLAERATGDGSSVVPMTRHLVTTAGIHPSRQRRTDWFTALHVACERGLYALAVCLVTLGADVNAVARDDIMPIHCAEKAPDPAPFLELLRKRGARRTWRRDTISPTSIHDLTTRVASALTFDNDPGEDTCAWLLDTSA